MRRVLVVASFAAVVAGFGYCVAVYGFGMHPADVLGGIWRGVTTGAS